MPEETEIDIENIDVLDKKDPNPFILVSIIALFAVAIFLVFVVSQNKDTETSQTEKIEKEFKIAQDPFKKTILSAKAAYVFDVRSQETLYAYNEEAQLPLASITKLMTALIVSEKIPHNKYVFVTNTDIATEGDNGLLAGEGWEAEKLLGFMLMTSSNDGAQALANATVALSHNSNSGVENDFTDLMNQKAHEIGLSQTYFLNPTGLDTTEQVSGGYGSAQDVASLLYYSLNKDASVLESTAKLTKDYYSNTRKHTAENTNQLIEHIPGLIASKTGLTDLAGGNLVVAFDAGINRPIIVVVLGSTEEGRFDDVKQLVDATLQSLSERVDEYVINKN